MTDGGSPSSILDAFEEKVQSVIGDTDTGIKSGEDTEEGKQCYHICLDTVNISLLFLLFT